MRIKYKLIITLIAVISSLLLFSYYSDRTLSPAVYSFFTPDSAWFNTSKRDYNVWCTFTKTTSKNAKIAWKFQHMLVSLLSKSSVPLRLNIIVDNSSKTLAEEIFYTSCNITKVSAKVAYYDVLEVTTKMVEIISALRPHFSPKPGSYYSDSLFFISTGLELAAPAEQEDVIMLDVDLQFEDDIALLFEEFNKFGEEEVVGACPELSPVYYHLLWGQGRGRGRGRVRAGPGSPCCPPGPAAPRGQPGFNSGVLLLRLGRARASTHYRNIRTATNIAALANNFSFKGHLGDQDFYSLLDWCGTQLVHTVDCGWNRQLCTWWREHGYASLYDDYAHCPSPPRVLHANCDSHFPQAPDL